MRGERSSFTKLMTDAREGVARDYATHVNPQFARLLDCTGFDRRYVRGEGAKLWDDAGTEYLDCIGGYAVHAIGRNHPDMIATLTEALHSGVPSWVQFERNPLAALLARRLAERTPGDLQHAFFSNSGTEAIECALKLARRATNRSAVLHCAMSFHGLTLGALAANGNEHLRDGFGPLGESKSIPFDDLAALEQALASRQCAAFLVEPVQGKSCRSASDGYLGEAARLCKKHGTLLVIDEVQTGVGRTGKFLACEHDAACQPDMLVLSKALSGGLVPVGATLVRSDIWAKTFDSMSHALVHASTFQSGVLAMTAALTTIEIHDREQLSARAARLGSTLRSAFESAAQKYHVAKEVRGRGLMLGIGLHKDFAERLLASIPLLGNLERVLFGQAFTMELLAEHRILCQVSDSHSNILKFTPPLVIDDASCAQLIQSVNAVFAKFESPGSASLHGAARVVLRARQ